MIPEQEQQSRLWRRWGWLAGAVWIVFLMFPITFLLEVQRDPVPRVVGLALIAAFAIVYVAAFVAITRCEHEGWRGSPWALLVMTALVAAVGAFIGVDALGMAPFVISFAIWGLRWPVSLWTAAGFAVAAILVVLVAGGLPDRWIYPMLVTMVLGFGVLMRVLDRQTERQAEVSEVMAVVTERERVARDVHDVLGHSLTAISVKAELAERLLEVDLGRAAAELSDVQTLARDALADIRSTVSGLRATRIADEIAAARDALTAAGIEADLPDDADTAEPRNRIVLAWALREAVTNVVRHSRARRCTVELGPDRLVVRDDGVGTDAPEGNGLRGLRERVAASGGALELRAGPDGRGHELEVRL